MWHARRVIGIAGLSGRRHCDPGEGAHPLPEALGSVMHPPRTGPVMA